MSTCLIQKVTADKESDKSTHSSLCPVLLIYIKVPKMPENLLLFILLAAIQQEPTIARCLKNNLLPRKKGIFHKEKIVA